ncbi:hypothetical protein Tco_1533369 [Tanacetum coccineum]
MCSTSYLMVIDSPVLNKELTTSNQTATVRDIKSVPQADSLLKTKRSEELKKKDHKSFHDYSKYEHVRLKFSIWQNQEKITYTSSKSEIKIERQGIKLSYLFLSIAFAAKEDTTADIWIRKNTRSPLVARAEEALSSRTVNIDRKRKNTSPLLAIHPEDALFTRSIRRRYTPATSNICRANTNKNSPFTNIQNLSSNTTHARDDTPSYMDLGDCDQQCRHCGCLFWYNERLKGSHYTREAEYHLCCGGGQIHMPPTPDPPAFIQQLFKNNQFMEHIRAYNQMFAMTSFGAKIDHSVNKGRGPYVFKISG